MKRHAIPARPDELAERAERRRARIARRQADTALIRQALIYTAAGVLDMSRRHKPNPAAPEVIVGRIGGARTW